MQKYWLIALTLIQLGVLVALWWMCEALTELKPVSVPSSNVMVEARIEALEEKLSRLTAVPEPSAAAPVEPVEPAEEPIEEAGTVVPSENASPAAQAAETLESTFETTETEPENLENIAPVPETEEAPVIEVTEPAPTLNDGDTVRAEANASTDEPDAGRVPDSVPPEPLDDLGPDLGDPNEVPEDATEEGEAQEEERTVEE